MVGFQRIAPFIFVLMIYCWAVACEDEHPPVVRTPVVEFTLRDAKRKPIVDLAFDPRGIQLVKVGGQSADNWVRDSQKSGAWHYREWQWWKEHPWGESCRPRYWTTAKFSTDERSASIRYQIDGFDCEQRFLLPEVVERESPYWDMVISVENISGEVVEEYGQFFACYTNFNEPNSCWFWEEGNRLTRFAERGVGHLNGYVAHPNAYFNEGGKIPHCPRGGGKIVSHWYRPVMVSHATPEGWRSVIMLETEHAAGLAQGIDGGAMDYIVFPGPDVKTFENGERFEVSLRHYLLKSPELPSVAKLEGLWREFVVDVLEDK